MKRFKIWTVRPFDQKTQIFPMHNTLHDETRADRLASWLRRLGFRAEVFEV